PAALIVAREGDTGVINTGCIVLEVKEFRAVGAVSAIESSTEVSAHRVARRETERSIPAKALMAPTPAALDTDIDTRPVLDRRWKSSRWRCFSQYIGRRSTLSGNAPQRSCGEQCQRKTFKHIQSPSSAGTACLLARPKAKFRLIQGSVKVCHFWAT